MHGKNTLFYEGVIWRGVTWGYRATGRLEVTSGGGGGGGGGRGNYSGVFHHSFFYVVGNLVSVSIMPRS